MVSKRLILQGFTPRSHVECVRELLNLPRLERAILSVAFVSDGGVRLIADDLRAHGDKVTVFAGIRNEITSRQGLERLLASGTKLVTVDTGSTHLLYHPKIYYSRGQEEARLIVGSANLTAGGLNNNVEASVVLELDLSVRDDAALAEEVEREFDSLEGDFPRHVREVADVAGLVALQNAGRLLDEAETVRPRVTRLKGGEAEDEDRVPKITLRVPPIRLEVRKPARVVQEEVQEVAGVVEEGMEPAFIEPALSAAEYELVWESKPLTERDLNIPVGENTNQTGSMNLDKGLLSEDIDHRHYFRDEVFNKLEWQPRSETVDEATATFHAVLKGIPIGTFQLNIRHTTSTTSAAYLQRNAMTRLSWGGLRDHVRRRDLLTRTARLYRSSRRPAVFLVEID